MITALLVFLAGYTLSALVITVGYHRGLAHGAVQLHPALRGFIVVFGNWITGLDPKGWSIMHRRHHAFSDTEHDPHSPQNVGLTGILLEQLRSYEATLRGVARKDPEYMQYADGLDFELNWLNRRGLWWLPYALHVSTGIALGFLVTPAIGLAWALGILSHPLQGGMVNALGHSIGGRNFATSDRSTNNLLAAILVAGEGYQNNHHAFPDSAKFSYRSWEVDWGFGASILLEGVGLLTINYQTLIPEQGYRVGSGLSQ
ncbi:MAG: fatty-acid desaturase [Myxococcota bacterium]|jgi:fatty-acid desaturase